MQKIITFLIFILFGGALTFIYFWDFPAPSKKIERKIEIDRFK